MKSLLDVYNSGSYNTDKNTAHSYIDNVYNELFKDIDCNKVLEIGVFFGGSILLWRDYFNKAEITAVDVNDSSKYLHGERIKHLIGNAYSVSFVNSLDNDYDIIIDDGPHTLDSMKFFVTHYTSKLNKGGVAIIEDIQSIYWIDTLTELLTEDFSYEVFDLRKIKNRYDDILLVIRRK